MGGNTPTGVGKTRDNPANRKFLEKHPHGRGEDILQRAQIQIGVETPPRAWGRRYHTRTQKTELRNTPTGVGKTANS